MDSSELFQRTVLRAALPVCLPYFAQETRNGEDMRNGYLRAVSYLTSIGWPFFVFLATMAYPAIRILYGLQWLASVPLASILCMVAAIEVTYALAKEVLIANGDVRAANHLQAIQQLIGWPVSSGPFLSALLVHAGACSLLRSQAVSGHTECFLRKSALRFGNCSTQPCSSAKITLISTIRDLVGVPWRNK